MDVGIRDAKTPAAKEAAALALADDFDRAFRSGSGTAAAIVQSAFAAVTSLSADPDAGARSAAAAAAQAPVSAPQS